MDEERDQIIMGNTPPSDPRVPERLKKLQVSNFLVHKISGVHEKSGNIRAVRVYLSDTHSFKISPQIYKSNIYSCDFGNEDGWLRTLSVSPTRGFYVNVHGIIPGESTIRLLEEQFSSDLKHDWDDWIFRKKVTYQMWRALNTELNSLDLTVSSLKSLIPLGESNITTRGLNLAVKSEYASGCAHCMACNLTVRHEDFWFFHYGKIKVSKEEGVIVKYSDCNDLTPPEWRKVFANLIAIFGFKKNEEKQK